MTSGITPQKILTLVAGGKMDILINSLAVFALTLIVTKSKILAGKREFVEQRYDAAKVGDQQPGWIHRWWHAVWTCPMCSGFWFAIPVAILFPVYNLFLDILVIFALNWIIHCIENVLFFGGETFEGLSDVPFNEMADKHRHLTRRLESFLKSR